MTDTLAAAQIKTQLRHLLWATVGSYLLVVGGVVAVGRMTLHNRQQAARTNAVLCTYRSDLEGRISSEGVTVAFPEAFGISASSLAALRVTIASQKHTVDSLKGLKC